jgi:16S rRNA (guanine966-N2)-methyltransferase
LISLVLAAAANRQPLNIMRIIAGKCRGRRLKGPEGLDLRPTGDRLKESLFNILTPLLNNAVFMDVFGGTGSIGIEALSRGARQVVFIESTVEGCRLIRKNLELCGMSAGYRILQKDAFMAMRALARERFKANIVFFDPPYDFEPYRDLLGIVFRKSLLSKPSLVIIEHQRKAVLPESGEGYRRVRMVRQGDQCLSFFNGEDPRDLAVASPKEVDIDEI